MILRHLRGGLRAVLFTLLGLFGYPGPASAAGPDMYFDAPADKQMAIAVASGDIETMTALLSSKAIDPQAIGRKVTSWIEIAVIADQRKAFDTLVTWDALGPPKGKIAGQAMYSATIKGSIRWLERLHRAGASLDNYGGGDLLIVQALDTRNEAVLDFYIRNGADLNMPAMAGGSVALSAAMTRRFDMVLKFLDLGASPWVMDALGSTLGSIAERAGRVPAWDHSSRMNQHRLELLARLHAIGFPDPAPTAEEGHVLRQKKQWPPKAAIRQ
ncbi:hypothetical protein MHY87_12250 [Microvirga sp. ACRRW]|uniref:hypothetical protein n=1 Tax=Microvirga sp. ACRRW TaxID=2918205 RepID=UPI001EF41866|nr:hypothetical protein [Microvirga sp. ACRRW]MCG7393680.1 hypothetical protein [Microvirga sp. ACRRW]